MIALSLRSAALALQGLKSTQPHTVPLHAHIHTCLIYLVFGYIYKLFNIFYQIFKQLNQLNEKGMRVPEEIGFPTGPRTGPLSNPIPVNGIQAEGRTKLQALCPAQLTILPANISFNSCILKLLNQKVPLFDTVEDVSRAKKWTANSTFKTLR